MSASHTPSPSTTTLPDLNVSLEPHLSEALRPLLALLPDQLASQLKKYLVDATPQLSPAETHCAQPDLIPYELLYSISAWSRSRLGVSTLWSCTPPLEPNQYSMVSLLAGTRTSPERKFPHTPSGSRDHEAEAKRELSDRRAVVAVLNALLSILGSGAATWWAAERLSWKDEWKVLLALTSAIVVAVAEGILYLIWDSRRNKSTRRALNTRAPVSTKDNIRVSRNPHTPDKAVPISDDAPPLNPHGESQLNVQLHHDIRGLRERTQRPATSRGEHEDVGLS